LFVAEYCESAALDIEALPNEFWAHWLVRGPWSAILKRGVLPGGARGTRTPGPLLANRVLRLW